MLHAFMLFVSAASIAVLRIVDGGAEHCLVPHLKYFFSYERSNNLGTVLGVGNTRTHISHHGWVGEIYRLNNGQRVLCVFYAKHCEGNAIPFHLRSGTTMAECGIQQLIYIRKTDSTVQCDLRYTAPDGRVLTSTCNKTGRLFAARFVGVATPSQLKGVPRRNHSKLLNDDRRSTALLNTVALPVVTPAKDSPTTGHIKNEPTPPPPTSSTAEFDGLRGRMGHAPDNRVATMLRKWHAQEVRSGDITPTRLKRGTRKLDFIIGTSKAKPLRPVDSKALQKAVGSVQPAAVFGSILIGDHQGGRFPESYQHNRYCHVWYCPVTKQNHTTVHATADATQVLLSLQTASRAMNLPWDLRSDKLNLNSTAGGQQVRLYHDNHGCYKAGFKKFTEERYGFTNVNSYPNRSGTMRTYLVEREHYAIAQRGRANLQLAQRNLKRFKISAVGVWDHMWLLAGLQRNLEPDDTGTCPKERAWGREITRNEHKAMLPAMPGALGYQHLERQVRSRTGGTTFTGTGNTTMADRSKPVLFMGIDESMRWKLFCCRTFKIFYSRDVIWDKDLPAPAQPASNYDTTNVDWATVAEIHTGADFDTPVDVTQPMPTPDELPQLTTLGMLTTMITEADASTIDDGTTVMTAWDIIPETEKDALLSAQDEALRYTETSGDLGTASVKALFTMEDSGGTAPQSITELRAEVFSLYCSGVFPDADNDMQPEGTQPDEQAPEMVACAGDFALMATCGHDYHIIDTRALAAKVEQVGTGIAGRVEDHVSTMTYDDVRIKRTDAIKVPRSIKAAMLGKYGALWKKAYEAEAGQFIEGKTFSTVPIDDIPPDGRRCRLVCILERKYHDASHPTNPLGLKKFKVRMCVLGNRLKADPDDITASSTPALPIIRLLDHVALKVRMMCYSSDVSGAFLEGDIRKQNIYLILPPDLQDRWLDSNGRRLCWKLKKSVYGMRTSQADWSRTLHKHLVGEHEDAAKNQTIPLKRSQHEVSLYMLDHDQLCSEDKHSRLREQLVGPRATTKDGIASQEQQLRELRFYYVCFVDDARTYVSHEALAQIFAASYHSTFTVTGGRHDIHDGAPEEFLKIEISYRRINGHLRSKWSNDASLEKFLNSHGAKDLKPVGSPMEADVAKKITSDSMPKGTEAQRRVLEDLQSTGDISDDWSYAQLSTKYRSIVAGAGWQATTVYPLLSFAVSRLSVVMSNPTAVAWRSTKRLLRHMTSLQGKHLQYRRGESDEIDIWAQSDASLGDLSSDGRSQYGHLQRLSQKDGAYRWKSGRIPYSLISTGATELYSLSECCREVVADRMLLREMGFILTKPSTVLTDSKSAMINATHFLSKSATRAVRLRSWFCREACDANELVVLWASGKTLAADGLTKATDTKLHRQQMLDMMGMLN